MIQSSVMPTLVKIRNIPGKKHPNFRCRMQGLEAGPYYHVIAYDTQRLVITNEKADSPYTVKWEDVELIKSEWTISKSRSDTALLTELRLLRQSMSKLESALNRNKKSEQQESKK